MLDQAGPFQAQFRTDHPDPMRGLNLSRLRSVRFAPDDKERKARVWRVLCRHFFQKHVDRADTVLDVAFVSNFLAVHPVHLQEPHPAAPGAAQWLLGRQSCIVAVRPR
jgi:hypothetical protein